MPETSLSGQVFGFSPLGPHDKKNPTPLQVVSHQGPVEAQFQCRNGHKPRKAESTTVQWHIGDIASQEGAVEVVKWLLTTGRADMNIGDGDCRTPLHLASQNHDTYDFVLL
jgi:hypothetical protein